jgi:N-acetylglucosaminyl-diphospho-decaprenol L-rhamnosyltransferase
VLLNTNFNSATGISVVIVSWNSGAFLPRCLASLSAQTFRDFEVILVDNNSTDDSAAGQPEKHPRLALRVERLPSNTGFAAANNLGARLAHGRWLALLNPDAFPSENWLAELVKNAHEFPENSFFASRQIQAEQPQILDGEGDVYHVSGLAWRRNYNLPLYPTEASREVFSACAAAMLVSRREFLKVGGFDEDYFAYLEDVDLGFRLRMTGSKCFFVPEAVVHHVGSASTSKRSNFSVYHGYRNLIWTYIKDMPAPLFWYCLPGHIAVVLFFFLVYTWRGQAGAAWRGLGDGLAGLRSVLAKRKDIQRNMKVHWRDIYSRMSTSPLEPYREFVKRDRGA